MVDLSDDALVFAAGVLNGPKSTLSFGGRDAAMKISPRARAALNELLAAGVVESAPPTDQIPGREHYRGKIPIGPMLKDRGLNPFDDDSKEKWEWKAFVPNAPEATQ